MNLLKKLFGRQSKINSPDAQPEKKSEVAWGNIILEFQKLILKPVEWNELSNVEFAMWYPCEEDKQFAKSPIVIKWTAIYSITKHYWSYISADILKAMKIVDGKTFRQALPDNFQAFAFLTTDDQQIVLSLSQEKGIRLHFANSTSLAYRSLFLDSFILYCKAWKELITLNNGSQDDDLGFDNWWKSTLETSKAVEQEKPLTGVGQIVK